jgi:WD40 repeat protein/class 3 adenylate cyclase
MSELPSGTVTFLFTDIEGSTRLLQQLGANLYGQLLSDHRAILRGAFEEFAGTEIGTEGDAFFVSFPRTTEAVAAVVQIQKAMDEYDWPNDVEVRVRMGLHTGEPWVIEEDYVGMDVHRAARIAQVGHGGQVLLSETTVPLVQDKLPEGVELLDLGRHRLKDMRRPEHIQQLVIDGLPSEFPPLNSLESLSAASIFDGETKHLPRQVGENPYRGLAAFGEADAPFFFGREAFTEELYGTVTSRPMTAVIVASSGAGKSSAVAAGLLPRLRSEGNWLILQFRPGSQPFLMLATILIPVLEPDLDEMDRLIATQKMASALRNREVSLLQIVDRALHKGDAEARLLLIADQFEELYTLCPDPEVRQAFLDELLAAVHGASGQLPARLVLLLTLRADFMGQALAHRPFADELKEGALLLGPMNREELQAAIKSPAEKQGAAFETGLVDRILDDVGQEPGNLPLLEFTLTLLWDRMDQGWMTHAAYEAIGRVDGALSRHADQVYGELGAKEQEQSRRMFVQLVQPGEGTEDTRRLARWEELVGVDWILIQQLADKRLVVTGSDESGSETVEVVHEALIRGWGQLGRWMDADRDFRRWQEGLRAAFRAWEESNRDDGALLRGAPLVQAEDWLANRGDEIGETEQEYIRVSAAFQLHRLHQRERRRRLIVGGLVVGFVVALILSVFAFSQRNSAVQNAALAEGNAALAERNAATAEAESLARATQQVLAEDEAAARATQQNIAEDEAQARATQQAIAEDEVQARATQQAIAEDERSRAENEARLALSRNLALDASRNLAGDPELSLLLALQAVEQTYSIDSTVLPDALTALHQSVQANSRLLLTIPGKTGRTPYVSFHPNGKLLTVYYFQAGVDPKSFPGNTLTSVYDAYTGELKHELPEGTLADHWPDSGHVAMVDLLDERTLEVTIWDSAEGVQKLQSRLEIPYETVLDDIPAMILSEELDLFALSLRSGHTLIWEIDSGELQTDIFEDIFDERSPVIPGERSGAFQRQYIGGEEFFNSTLTSYVIFVPDGSHFITTHLYPRFSFQTSILRLWDLANPDLPAVARSLSEDAGRIVSPDGNSLAETWNNNVSLHGFENGEVPVVLFGRTSADVGIPTFSPDSSSLATVGGDGIVWVWDAGFSLATGGEKLNLSLSVSDESIYNMSLSPDGSRLATVGGDGQVRIWDVRTSGGIELLNLASSQASDAGDWVSIAISPDGRHLAVADASPSPKVWDTETGEQLFLLTGHADAVEEIAYSPDGTIIATCSYAGPLKLWDAHSGAELAELDQYNDGHCSLDFDPDGDSIALGIVRNEAGWFQVMDFTDLETGASGLVSLNRPLDLYGAHNSEPMHIAISPDGNRVALTYGGLGEQQSVNRETAFRIYDLASGGAQDLNWRAQDLSYVNLAYSPEGLWLAATLPNGGVEIWDTQSAELARTFSDHEGPVNQAAFSPDSRWLATAGADGTTRIWDLETGRETMVLFGHTGAVTDVTFSPDGSKLYTAGVDGNVRVYLMDLEELLLLGRSRLSRSLTLEECQTYLGVDECPEGP